VTYADDPGRPGTVPRSRIRPANGSAEEGQPRLAEPYPAQAYSAQPYPDQPYPARAYPADPSPTVVPPPDEASNARAPAGPPPEPEPADAGPPDFGYAGAAEVAGRPITEIVYWLALALAAGADVAAFHQVVSLVLRNQGDSLIWLMVVGLTAIALTLAHFAGRVARDITAKRGTASWKQFFACAIPWVALGIAAFAIRLIVADASVGTTVDGTTVGGGDIGRPARQASAAVLFLALYVGSGAVAAFGEFLNRNPLRSEYRRALRAHDKALTRLSRSQPPYELAVQVYRQHARSRAREEANWQAAREQRLAQADELKRYAAVLIAAHLQDPSVTDAMTLPDRRPIAGPDGPTPAGGTRSAIEGRRPGRIRPAIERRSVERTSGPQRSIEASQTTGVERTAVPRHTSPPFTTISPNDNPPDESYAPADRTRYGGRGTG
jgi:hypothetical protein